MTQTTQPIPSHAPATPDGPANDRRMAFEDGTVHIDSTHKTLVTQLLTPQVVAWIAQLHRLLEPERRRLLAARRQRQTAYDAGELPTYLPQDSVAVEGDWQVAETPADLQCRRVEITGPVHDPKLVINMLSRNAQGHRADTAMLDFEDSMQPTWENVLHGLDNVRRAVDGTLQFTKRGRGGQPDTVYRLDPNDQAALMVRVRGLHLLEQHVQVDGQPVCGGLFDLAVTLAHNGADLVAQGRTPKYYVPKCEHPEEARWWNRLFVVAQEALGLPPGTLRATFLIETLPAAFAMEEILYEIRHHAAALNVGRWDKIFSDIKVLKSHPDRLLADRASIGLERPWMRAYAVRLVQICHRRGALALGGMAAFTPGHDAARRAEQTAKVIADKELEASLGHDGCWISHPYFLAAAFSAFPRTHQRDVLHLDVDPYPDLLPRATPPHTIDGLRTNVRVGIAYMEGWRRGQGCIAWDDLMEDLATLEIARAQTWQWCRHRLRLDDGTEVHPNLVRRIFVEELERIHRELAQTYTDTENLAEVRSRFGAAAQEAFHLFTEHDLRPFLGTPCEPQADLPKAV